MSALSSPSFGSLLRQNRLAAGLTQEELAERSGLSPRAILALERGERRRPYRQTLELLASALRLSALEMEALRRAAGYAVSPGPPGLEAGAAVPPLVGRSRELASLERFLAGPNPPVLVLAGEPGIGKSRLLDEAARLAGGEGYAVLRGGGQRRSGQESYAPMLDTLARSVAGLSPSGLRSALTGCAWLVRLLPELLELADAPLPVGSLSANQERRLVFTAVARYLTNIAGPVGTLLVLDDLQWASSDGLDLLASLVQAEGGTSVRVLGAYRETDVGADHPLAMALAELAERQLAQHMAVDPLREADALALLDGLLGPMEDEGVKQRIVERAGGVPFFLVSCAHGLEIGDGGRTVPWTVGQSVRGRVAALPPAAREALCGAAILGGEVERAVLLRVVASLEDEALAGLDEACRARLLICAGRSAYRFAHDVVRESIEADLGEAERMRLHRKAAEALEGLPEEHPGRSRRATELAWHYLEGDEPERALPYAIRAGDEAAALSAHAEAQHHYRVALEVARRLGDDRPSARLVEATVLEKLSALLTVTPSADESLDLLQRAAGIYRSVGDQENEGRIIAQIGRAYYWGVGNTQERKIAGIAYIQAAQRSLGEDAPARTQAGLGAVLTHLLLSLGMYPQGLDAARVAADLARRSGDDGIQAEVEVDRGSVLITIGREEEGLQVLREALRLAEGAGDHFSQIRALYVQTALSWVHGSFDECRASTQRALEIARRTGHAWATEVLLRNLGLLDFVAGDWQGARQWYDQAVAYMRSVDETWKDEDTLGAMGWLELREGNTQVASRYLEESLLSSERKGERALAMFAPWVLAEGDLQDGHANAAISRLEPVLAGRTDAEESLHFLVTLPVPVLPTLAEAHLMLGDVGRADELVEASVRRCWARGRRPELAEALRVQGALYARRGRWPEAVQAIAEGLSVARSIAYPYAEARLLRAGGQMHAERGEPERGRVQLEEALTIFRRLGARPDAERSEQLLAQTVCW